MQYLHTFQYNTKHVNILKSSDSYVVQVWIIHMLKNIFRVIYVINKSEGDHMYTYVLDLTALLPL